MGGFVIDIVFMFLFKSFVRTLRFIKSSRWNRKTASVMDCIVLDPLMGCPSVKVHYQVVSIDRAQEGWNEIPFCFRRSAKQYAPRFSNNRSVTVRINPQRPDEMLFFEMDQKDG